MSQTPAPATICTHVKTNGVCCGSPAVKGTHLCFHHSAVKTALSKVMPAGATADGTFSPIPFVFPEDRAAIQIDYFLLLQAFNEGRIDLRTFNSMLRLFRLMDRNLGKSDSLVKDSPSGEASEQISSVDAPSGPKGGTNQTPKSEARKQAPTVAFNAPKIPTPYPAKLGKQTGGHPAIDLNAAATRRSSTTGYLSLDEVVARLEAMGPEYFGSASLL